MLWHHPLRMTNDELRSSLLALHKALLDEATKTYELLHGTIGGPTALFKLLLEEKSFQWLRPLSETIVSIDEALETEPPATNASLLAMTKGRLFPEKPTEFSVNLAEAMQKSESIRQIAEPLQKI